MTGIENILDPDDEELFSSMEEHYISKEEHTSPGKECPMPW